MINYIGTQKHFDGIISNEIYQGFVKHYSVK